MVTRILDSTAPSGTWQLHTIGRTADGVKTRDLEKEVLNYFPRIVPEDVYERVRAMRQDKVPVNRGNGLRSLLAGMARCSACGGAMTRIDKRPSSPKRGGRPVLVCMTAKVGAGCSYKSVRQEDVERAIIDALPMTPKFRTDARDAIHSLATRIGEIEDTIANLVEQAGMSPSKALSDQLYVEEEEKRGLERELDDVIAQASPLVQKRIVKRSQELVEVAAQVPLDVNRANALMRQLFERVVIDAHRRHIELWWHSTPNFYALQF
jgi:hypothetical protein